MAYSPCIPWHDCLFDRHVLLKSLVKYIYSQSAKNYNLSEKSICGTDCVVAPEDKISTAGDM